MLEWILLVHLVLTTPGGEYEQRQTRVGPAYHSQAECDRAGNYWANIRTNDRASDQPAGFSPDWDIMWTECVPRRPSPSV